LRIEKADMENMSFTLTVAEDLDYSGLPFADEVVFQYERGSVPVFSRLTQRIFFM
jgi:uncharacterized protein